MNFIDPSVKQGKGVVVWHFAVVLANCVLGDGVSIGSGAEIGRGTVIGDHSRISAHVFLPSNTKIGCYCFIGPGVVCTDDKRPRALNKIYLARPPQIEDGASIGAGAVILPGIRIGKNAMVGAGAIVTHDVPDDAVIRSEPARIRETPLRFLHQEMLSVLK
jgi:UDP-2-acetamido-3-amino-2,3-dideoxy-glucuronate N-acetyltransferase